MQEVVTGPAVVTFQVAREYGHFVDKQHDLAAVGTRNDPVEQFVQRCRGSTVAFYFQRTGG